jgi:outer membrane receptor protein involved in Fe transport
MYADNANLFPLGGYTLFNGRAGYTRGRYDWSVNAENLFNRKKYFTSAINSTQVYPGSPINMFATFRIRFQ